MQEEKKEQEDKDIETRSFILDRSQEIVGGGDYQQPLYKRV